MHLTRNKFLHPTFLMQQKKVTSKNHLHKPQKDEQQEEGMY
jgi:hypothetical protein